MAVTASVDSPAQAKTENSPPHASESWGWSSPGEAASKATFPHDEPSSSGWAPDKPQARHSHLDQGAAAPRAGESTKGWLNEHTLVTSEEDSYAWTPDPVADTLDFPLEEEPDLDQNDWVDEDLDDYDDYSESSSALVQTPVVDDTVAKFQWALLVAICLFFVSLVIVKLGKNSPETPVADTVQVETKTEADAALFLNEGENNLSFGKHSLAASQFSEAVAILEEAGAEPQKIEAAKSRQALALTQAKEFKEAYALWAQIPGKEAAAELNKVAKQLRIQAGETLAESKTTTKAGKPRQGEVLAKEGLAMYRSYGGSKAQITQALDTLAQAYLADNNTPRARIALKEAQGIQFSQERKRTLQSMEVKRVRPNQRDPKPSQDRPKRPPSLGEPSSIPTAEYPRGSRPNQSVSNDTSVQEKTFEERAREANAQYVPPPSGSSSSSGSRSDERAGSKGEVPGYSSSQSGSTSKIPGL